MSEPHLNDNTALKQPAAMSEKGNMTTNWREWKSSFDYYMIATGKENATSREKCALFLHIIGKSGQDILDELDLNNEAKSDYEKLVSKFARHYDPSCNVNVERHEFFQTYQLENSFDKFYNELKQKSKSCEFGSLRSSLILTQIIRGIREEELRKQLLKKSKLDLEEAVAWCRTAEQNNQQIKSISEQAKSASLQENSANQQRKKNSQQDNSANEDENSASHECQHDMNNTQQSKSVSEEKIRYLENTIQRKEFSSQRAESFNQHTRRTSHYPLIPVRPTRRVTSMHCAIRCCDYCGRKHTVGDKCLAWDAICYNCESVGHFARMCSKPEMKIESDWISIDTIQKNRCFRSTDI